jgi:hypothetical protein
VAAVEESVMVNVATPYQRVRFELARDDLHIEWPQSIGLALVSVVADLPGLLTSFAMVLAVWFLLLSIIGCVEVVHAEERTTVPVCLLQKRSVVDFLARVPRSGGEQERLGT